MEYMTCKICGHCWIPRTENPVRCPNCQNRIAKRTKEMIAGQGKNE